MSAIIGALTELYDFYMAKSDPRQAHLPLMSSLWKVLALIAFYLYFSLSLGQRLMEKRPAFDCKIPMMIYNLAQIILNGVLLLQILIDVWIPMRYKFICEEVDYSDDPLALKVAYFVWLYFMLKIMDWIDTVFMVLRKKNNQISFLHIYHHSGMVFAVWIASNFVPGGHFVFVGAVNTFVHIVMYGYYFLTSIYPEYKRNIWWKRHITELQLAQFISMAVHSVLTLVSPDCNYPKHLILLFLAQNFFMILMFWDFYKKAYFGSKKEDEKNS